TEEGSLHHLLLPDCITQSCSHYCLVHAGITSRSRSPALLQLLPSLSLCPQDELCRSILKQFWKLSQVNILPEIGLHG
ncbi:hypothetical protein Nmel_002331, partial [Mimus melanotis]